MQFREGIRMQLKGIEKKNSNEKSCNILTDLVDMKYF